MYSLGNFSLFPNCVDSGREEIGFRETSTVEQMIPAHINRAASLAFTPANRWPCLNQSQFIPRVSEKQASWAGQMDMVMAPFSPTPDAYELESELRVEIESKAKA